MKRSKKTTILWLALITLFCMLPLFAPGIEGREGQDLGFHLMRIEGIAAEWKKGVFPVKMQSLWMDGYGYPVSVYYGDFLLYFPAALRLLGVPVVMAYKIFAAAINALTAVISYVSFSSIFGKNAERKRGIALACTAAYMTAGYRLLNLYVRAAVGEYCAAMFLPLIAAAVYQIYRQGAKTGAERLKQSVLLALGLSGLIGTHLLTLEMTALILLAVGILFWQKTFSAPVFPTLLLAFAETVLLNLYFLIPFLDYYCNVSVYLNRVMGKAHGIQEDGANLFQLTAFWAEPFQQGDQSTHLIATPGLLLLLVLAAGVMMMVYRLLQRIFRKMQKRAASPEEAGDGRSLRLAGVSLLLLFLSTEYFPWDAVAGTGPVGQFLTQVQFPWRYVGMAVFFLTLTLGSLLEEVLTDIAGDAGKRIQKIVFPAVMLLSCFGAGLFTINYVRGYEPVYYADTEELDTWDMGMIEYLRYKTKREELSGETVKWENGDGSVTVELPVISYPGYHVVDSDGNEYNIRDGENNVIQFTLPADFEGTVRLYFWEPWYWRAAELTSLVTLAALVGGIWLCGEKKRIVRKVF